jgi:hypothetical protein
MLVIVVLIYDICSLFDFDSDNIIKISGVIAQLQYSQSILIKYA